MTYVNLLNKITNEQICYVNLLQQIPFVEQIGIWSIKICWTKSVKPKKLNKQNQDLFTSRLLKGFVEQNLFTLKICWTKSVQQRVCWTKSVQQTVICSTNPVCWTKDLFNFWICWTKSVQQTGFVRSKFVGGINSYATMMRMYIYIHVGVKGGFTHANSLECAV